MPNLKNQELIDQVKSEMRAVADSMKESNVSQQIQNDIKKAEDNISQLISNYGEMAVSIPIDPSEIAEMGGRAKNGILNKRELQGDIEVRVSLRSSKFLGTIEVFTIRNMEPADYHLTLLALPRNRDDS